MIATWSPPRRILVFEFVTNAYIISRARGSASTPVDPLGLNAVPIRHPGCPCADFFSTLNTAFIPASIGGDLTGWHYALGAVSKAVSNHVEAISHDLRTALGFPTYHTGHLGICLSPKI